MARPCGCGSGGLTVRCSTGVVCSGLGTATDPLVIQWENPLGTAACNAVMDCVGSRLGNGLAVLSGLLSVKIATGGGLEFDISGALRVTGTAPGGQPASVAALETLTQDVIGGALGAGFMIKPLNMLHTYQYGVEAGLHMMQVPVRFLSDGSPVVYMQETMELTTPAAAGQHVQDQDPHRWKRFALKPGHQILPSGDNTITSGDPKQGWFGYLEPGEPELVYLAEVLRQVGGKIVLVLDLRFPATDASNNFVRPTPVWRTDIFRARVLQLIQDLGLSGSVIVTTSTPLIKSSAPADPPVYVDVLKPFSDQGIAVGPFLETLTAANAWPTGPTWPANWTWAFLSWTIPPATLQAYVNQQVGSPAKPLNVILFYVTRQYLRNSVVNNNTQTPGATGVGAKGVLSADPEYYRARLDPLRYRKFVNTFVFHTVSHGLLPHQQETLDNINCLQRGHHIAPYTSMWFGPANFRPPDPISTTSFSLQGWFGPCPPENLNNRFYDVGMGFDQLGGGASNYGWMAMAFGVPTDHIFQNYGSPPAPAGIDYSLDNGYILLLDSNGFLFVWCITNGNTESMATAIIPYDSPPVVIGSPGWSDTLRGKPYYFRVGINANGLKISRITTPGQASPSSTIYTLTDERARRHRGSYVYFGRRGSFWNGFIDNPMMGFSGAAPNGPA